MHESTTTGQAALICYNATSIICREKMMVRFANAQRQLPEFWVQRRGSVTVRETMRQYRLKDEQTAEEFLNNLVRQGRLVRNDEDGVMRWSRRQ